MGVEKNIGGFRAKEVERADRRLGGFVSLFEELPDDLKQEVIDTIDKLREKLTPGSPELIKQIKALGEIYTTLIKETEKTESQPNDINVRLKVKLAEFLEAIQN